MDLIGSAPEYGGIALAAVLGAVVGAERQLRSRNAGVRTNALVALGAALFVVMGAHAFAGPEADPTRVAAQVASGVGFLGAGVIMKQGASISGLNSAATLWAAAAVGALAGGGLWALAATGAGLVVLVNVCMRPLGRVLDRTPETAREQPRTDYRLDVTCEVADEADVRRLVFDAVHHSPLSLRSIAAVDDELGDRVRIVVVATAEARDDVGMEEAVSRIVTAPPVLAIRWTADPVGD